VKELRSAGFSPDFIVCRAKKAIEVSSKNKISLFCNVDKENVLSIPDVSNIYHVPLLLLQQDFHHLLSKKLNLNVIQQEKLRVLAGVEAGVGAMEEESKEIIINKSLVKSWEDMVVRIDSATDDVSIALIGKYTNQQDSYLSVISALKHSCIATDQKLKLLMIESSSLEQETKERDPALFEAAWKSLKSADGILVPGTAHEHRAFISKFQLQTIQSPRCHNSFLYYPLSNRHCDSYLSSPLLSRPSRWIWGAGHRGQSRGGAVCQREQGALPRHLSGHAGCGDRVH
jgi:CTP synthase (UTP-ammonia lyase)